MVSFIQSLLDLCDLRQMVGKTSCREEVRNMTSCVMRIEIISLILLIQNEDCQMVVLMLLSCKVHNDWIACS